MCETISPLIKSIYMLTCTRKIVDCPWQYDWLIVACIVVVGTLNNNCRLYRNCMFFFLLQMHHYSCQMEMKMNAQVSKCMNVVCLSNDWRYNREKLLDLKDTFYCALKVLVVIARKRIFPCRYSFSTHN